LIGSETAIKKGFPIQLVASSVYHKLRKQGKNYFCIKANTMSKLLLISHLLLGEKTLQAAEGGAPNSFGKSGKTAWAALCAAHSAVPSKPLSSILVSLLYQARTYFQNK